MSRLRQLLFFGFTLLVAACGITGDVEPPMVSLADLRIERMGLFEQEARVTLRLRNPNDADLPLNGAKFAIRLNGEPFARGVSNESITVPRLGEATMDALMTVSTFDVLNQFLGLGNTQNLTYELEGTAYYSGLGLIRRSTPFSQTGQLKLGNLGGGQNQGGGSLTAPILNQGGSRTFVPM